MKANEILDDAKDLILNRGIDYGTPAINHLRIARLWSSYLDVQVEPNQVAICMALVKIARIQESPHHADSYKDGCSYIAIAGQIASTDWDDLDSY
jgi:hypothetical protein